MGFLPLFLKMGEIQLICVLLRIVPYGEKVIMQEREGTKIITHKDHSVKSKENMYAYLQVGKAEMMFQN